MFSWLKLGLLLCLMILTSSLKAENTPDQLPLLPPGLHVGVLYSPPEDAALQPQAEAALIETIAAGLSVYAVPISWRDLEKSPGEIDTAFLESALETLSAAGLQPYLSITTVNTVKLTVPPDLMTADEYELAENRHFDDPLILERFFQMLDEVVPLMVEHGGFFISVGNEVDGWLEQRPDEIDGFVQFTAAARDYIHTIEPRMAVGATLGYGAIQREFAFVEDLFVVSDAVAYTYYPLNDDFSVRDPSVVAADLARMVTAAGDLPVLFQEVGYPSGYLPTPGNGSSEAMQHQFIETFFAEVRQYPQVRFVSVLQLIDWSPQICDLYVRYYANLDSFPQLHEYLCSLGLYTYDVQPKPAYAAFLTALQTIRE